MDKLERDLVKRIAEIEKIEFFGNEGDGRVWFYDGEAYSESEYNPLTDDALCFQLMIKHTVNLEYCLPEVGYFASIKGEHDSGNQESPNRAILLAIVEANNG